jgi:hypothetical protein
MGPDDFSLTEMLEQREAELHSYSIYGQSQDKFKTFPSTEDLHSLPPRSVTTTGLSTSIDLGLGPISEDDIAISNDDWVERTYGVDDMKIAYELGGVLYYGGSKWKACEEEPEVLRSAWAHCETKVKQRLELEFPLNQTTREMTIRLQHLEMDKPVYCLEKVAKWEFELGGKTDLVFYCNSISEVIKAANVPWLTDDIMRRFEAHIEKVVFSVLGEFERKRQEALFRYYGTGKLAWAASMKSRTADAKPKN